MAVSLSLAGGCKSMPPIQKPAVLDTKKDVARHLMQALEHERPEARQAAIARVAHTRHAQSEVVRETLCTIARTDASSMVRCEAIRALNEHSDPSAAATLAAIAATFDSRSQIRLPSPQVRVVALGALSLLAQANELDEETKQVARQAAIQLVGDDESRDVRIEAARFLGFCPDTESLSALIAGLNQRDFGVVYQADRSLSRLTGQTFDQDPQAWEKWKASHSDPFFAHRATNSERADTTQ